MNIFYMFLTYTSNKVIKMTKQIILKVLLICLFSFVAVIPTVSAVDLALESDHPYANNFVYT